MDRWEYLVENWTMPVDATNREEFENELNEYGQDGWELVTLIPKTGVTDDFLVFHQLLFKRKLDAETKNPY